MGNTVTTCRCCENNVSELLPWILDHAYILKRMPSRAEYQPQRYQKDEEEEQSSERESEKQQDSDEEVKEEKNNSSSLGAWLFGYGSKKPAKKTEDPNSNERQPT